MVTACGIRSYQNFVFDDDIFIFKKDKITKTENETKSWKDLIDTGEE